MKGGGKVEVKISPPPLETSLYKGIFVNLVEVEVKSDIKIQKNIWKSPKNLVSLQSERK